MSKIPMINKQLLIFDFDGTLIDSVPDLADATNAMLAQLGKATYPLETIEQWVGNGARMLVERALSGQVESDPSLSAAEIEAAEKLFFCNCFQFLPMPQEYHHRKNWRGKGQSVKSDCDGTGMDQPDKYGGRRCRYRSHDYNFSGISFKYVHCYYSFYF